MLRGKEGKEKERGRNERERKGKKLGTSFHELHLNDRIVEGIVHVTEIDRRYGDNESCQS